MFWRRHQQRKEKERPPLMSALENLTQAITDLTAAVDNAVKPHATDAQVQAAADQVAAQTIRLNTANGIVPPAPPTAGRSRPSGNAAFMRLVDSTLTKKLCIANISSPAKKPTSSPSPPFSISSAPTSAGGPWMTKSSTPSASADSSPCAPRCARARQTYRSIGVTAYRRDRASAKRRAPTPRHPETPKRAFRRS